jgi:hypothetical protein
VLVELAAIGIGLLVVDHFANEWAVDGANRHVAKGYHDAGENGVVGYDGLVLFNESFAATNERKGSIRSRRQIVTALAERNVRVVWCLYLRTFAA